MTNQTTPAESVTEEIAEALIKDFNALYVKQFTTDWESLRILRKLEISVMTLDNLEKYISQALDKQKEAIVAELSMIHHDGKKDDEYVRGYNRACDELNSKLDNL